MSKYKEITVDLKNAGSLVKALKELGLECKYASTPTTNDVKLVDWYGNESNAAIVIEQNSFRKAAGLDFSYGTIAFGWTGSGYQMVADHLDNNQKVIDQIKQRYTYNEVIRMAQAKGYTANDKSQGSTLRLVLSK